MQKRKKKKACTPLYFSSNLEMVLLHLSAIGKYIYVFVHVLYVDVAENASPCYLYILYISASICSPIFSPLAFTNKKDAWASITSDYILPHTTLYID